jgi:hypothetical protein
MYLITNTIFKKLMHEIEITSRLSKNMSTLLNNKSMVGMAYVVTYRVSQRPTGKQLYTRRY